MEFALLSQKETCCLRASLFLVLATLAQVWLVFHIVRLAPASEGVGRVWVFTEFQMVQEAEEEHPVHNLQRVIEKLVSRYFSSVKNRLAKTEEIERAE